MHIFSNLHSICIAIQQLVILHFVNFKNGITVIAKLESITIVGNPDFYLTHRPTKNDPNNQNNPTCSKPGVLLSLLIL